MNHEEGPGCQTWYEFVNVNQFKSHEQGRGKGGFLTKPVARQGSSRCQTVQAANRRIALF